MFSSATAFVAQVGCTRAGRPETTVTLSYRAGKHDPDGHFAGGTEMRVMTAHEGKLYGGNGYWEDIPGQEGAQAAQILVLETPDGAWRVDHDFDERLPDGRRRHLAVSALQSIQFDTDGRGKTLSQPVSLLLASTWDLTGTSQVFTRHNDTGRWSALILSEDKPTPNFLPQIRCFGSHKDRVTGADLVFAGQMPRGIFSGSYDPQTKGHIRWSSTPEITPASISNAFAGLHRRLRVTSFAEANGRLYATIGQHVFERIDGPSPQWRSIYTNSIPGRSETGLRGLTAVPFVGTSMLLATVEGTAARVLRINPETGENITELDLCAFLSQSWRMDVRYVIAAYNDMTSVSLPEGENVLLIGLMAFVAKKTPVPAGHHVVDIGYGVVEAGAWYLLRWPDGHYMLRQLAAPFPQAPVAIRAIKCSPFPEDGNSLYFAGYDANKASAHNSAWIARAQRI
ncbi:hypothetical protein AA0498_1191 [Acidomonas methanolica]|uniref:Uncharacterized protein n=2 Tax=Acidomonas methanolica TaxID=437 RepID=A0A023D8S2_ACIMT|nr:hypothetical protein Amme_166_001 [Acidomonas methanolica NBRC 104435]GBQ50348.1 hypothetical protein AA0498_1191 [Acidomonas methanolica]